MLSELVVRAALGRFGTATLYESMPRSNRSYFTHLTSVNVIKVVREKVVRFLMIQATLLDMESRQGAVRLQVHIVGAPCRLCTCTTD